VAWTRLDDLGFVRSTRAERRPGRSGKEIDDREGAGTKGRILGKPTHEVDFSAEREAAKEGLRSPKATEHGEAAKKSLRPRGLRTPQGVAAPCNH
jgi:hypothetical protein